MQAVQGFSASNSLCFTRRKCNKVNMTGSLHRSESVTTRTRRQLLGLPGISLSFPRKVIHYLVELLFVCAGRYHTRKEVQFQSLSWCYAHHQHVKRFLDSKQLSVGKREKADLLQSGETFKWHFRMHWKMAWQRIKKYKLSEMLSDLVQLYVVPLLSSQMLSASGWLTSKKKDTDGRRSF